MEVSGKSQQPKEDFSLRVKAQSSVLAAWSPSNLLLTLCRFVNTSPWCPSLHLEPSTPYTHMHTVHVHLRYTHYFKMRWRPKFRPLSLSRWHCALSKVVGGLDLQLKWARPSSCLPLVKPCEMLVVTLQPCLRVVAVCRLGWFILLWSLFIGLHIVISLLLGRWMDVWIFCVSVCGSGLLLLLASVSEGLTCKHANVIKSRCSWLQWD